MDLLAKREYLVHSIPILYLIYLISSNFKLSYLIIIIIYAGLIICQALVREHLLYKIRKSNGKFTTKEFSIFFKQNIFFIIAAIALILFGFITFIIMLVNEKNCFIWTLIFTYGIVIIYALIALHILPKYKSKREQIESYLMPGKK